MITNYWYVIANSQDVKKKPVAIKRFGEKIVLWRDSKAKLHAAEDRCLHRRTQLSIGRVMGDTIECPFHGFRYDGEGQCTLMPAKGECARISTALKIKTYSVKEARGFVWMWWGDETKKTEKLPWFEEFSEEGIETINIAKEAPLSFCRMMENNMDFSHFPFVHKSYFTANSKLVYAKDFHTTVQGDRIDISGFLAKDPANPEVITKELKVEASVLFPNMAMYEAPIDAENSQTVVCVAPIDDENVWFNVRLYVSPGRFVRLRKKIKEWVVLKFLWLKWVYLEDMRVWTRQHPKDNGFSDVLPCSSDGMIVAYLKMYAQHLKRMDVERAEQDALDHPAMASIKVRKVSVPLRNPDQAMSDGMLFTERELIAHKLMGSDPLSDPLN